MYTVKDSSNVIKRNTIFYLKWNEDASINAVVIHWWALLIKEKLQE